MALNVDRGMNLTSLNTTMQIRQMDPKSYQLRANYSAFVVLLTLLGMKRSAKAAGRSGFVTGKKKFGEELRKISVAKYAEFEAEIAKGNFDGLIDFASKVAGFSKSVAVTAAKDKKKVSKPSGVKLFSDFSVFIYFY